jgi:hypothetical protein
MLAFYIPKPGMKIWCKKYVQKFELGIFEIFGKPIHIKHFEFNFFD